MAEVKWNLDECSLLLYCQTWAWYERRWFPQPDVRRLLSGSYRSNEEGALRVARDQMDSLRRPIPGRVRGTFRRWPLRWSQRMATCLTFGWFRSAVFFLCLAVWVLVWKRFPGRCRIFFFLTSKVCAQRFPPPPSIPPRVTALHCSVYWSLHSVWWDLECLHSQTTCSLSICLGVGAVC